MKQIILIYCLGFILNSCVKEKYTVSNTEDNLVFKLEVAISTRVGDLASSTASVDNVAEVTVFVFDGNGTNNYLYRRSGIIPVNGQFTTKLLLTDEPIEIYVFTNPNSNVNSVNYDGYTKAAVLNNLTTDIDLNSGTNAFPMHGSLSVAHISENTIINTPVYLLRAMAVVDINAYSIDENIFKLESASVYNTPDNGCWVSNYRIDENGDPATPKVTYPTMPPTFSNITASPHLPIVTNNKLEEQLFIYENDEANTPASRAVISGIFNNNGTTAYYPVDFTNSNNIPIDILRNHRYTINITDVSGSGYSNAIDAANGESIDISADIIAWNLIDIDGDIGTSDVVFNSPSKVHLDHTNNNNSYTRTIAYSSNKDIKLYVDGIEVMFPGDNTAVGLNVQAPQSNWLTTATWQPTNNRVGVGELEFTHSTSTLLNPESYIITLKSGGITRNIEVFVSNMSYDAASETK